MSKVFSLMSYVPVYTFNHNLNCEENTGDTIDECIGFEEGDPRVEQHLVHERNSTVIKLAKLKFKEAHGGKLYCENCGFDFSEVYGERGNDFIEAHHIKPVSKMHAGDVTKVEDLVMLCCNCHKVVHLKKPWLTLRQLEKITNT